MPKQNQPVVQTEADNVAVRTERRPPADTASTWQFADGRQAADRQLRLNELASSSPRAVAQRALNARVAQLATEWEILTLRSRHAGAINLDFVNWDRVRNTKSYAAVFNMFDRWAEALKLVGGNGADFKTHKEAHSSVEKNHNGDYVNILGKAGKPVTVEDDDATHIDVDIDKVKLDDSDTALKMNLKPMKQELDLTIGKPLSVAKPGYVGTAIVYSGESNAGQLAKKYLEGSQDWEPAVRKSRVGVSFGVNNGAGFENSANATAESDVRRISGEAFGAVRDVAPANIIGFTWSYSYKLLEQGGSRTTAEVRDVLESGTLGGKAVNWKDKGQPSNRGGALAKLIAMRKEKGPPYGYLRHLVSQEAKYVESALKRANADPVYLHSLDADAPDFETLTEKEDKSGFKKVLDVYDDIIASQGENTHDLIIGGYNLTAQPGQYKGKDYLHTVKSNVIDIAIRIGVHAAFPKMTYPTEPNFLIKGDLYRDMSDKGNPWGRSTSEGRNLYNEAIRTKRDKLNVTYNPLASVPTGVDGGGKRLKIESGKKYDELSLMGKPYGTSPSVGDEVPVDEQYVVQAQSWSGASRLANAYVEAVMAKAIKPQSNLRSSLKEGAAKAFSSVETMVMELANGASSVTLDISEATNFDGNAVWTKMEDGKTDIVPIIRAIHTALNAAASSKEFGELLK